MPRPPRCACIKCGRFIGCGENILPCIRCFPPEENRPKDGEVFAVLCTPCHEIAVECEREERNNW